MKYRFKRIYIEITNRCNLSCSFCSRSRRQKEEMDPVTFEKIIQEIRPYTNNIYLHVKGEPLYHSKFDHILSICDRYQMRVNITTNGTLLKKQEQVFLIHPSITHLNISLHAEQHDPNYFNNLFSVVDRLPSHMTVIYRLWTLSQNKLSPRGREIFEVLKEHYHLDHDVMTLLLETKNIKIKDGIYVDKENQFEWPEVSECTIKNGYCYGGKTHLAILVDGTVVPCCLDGEGIMSLGNLKEMSLQEILHTKRYRNLIEGFQHHVAVEPLCQSCTYKNRFLKTKRTIDDTNR